MKTAILILVIVKILVISCLRERDLYALGYSSDISETGVSDINIVNDTRPLILNTTINFYKCPGANLSIGETYNFPSFFLDPFLQTNSSENFNASVAGESVLHCPSTSVFELSSSLTDENDAVFNQLLEEWLVVDFRDGYSESIPQERFCISNVNEDKVTLKYCRSDCRHDRCIPKCCLGHQICDYSTNQCKCAKTATRRKWASTLNSNMNHNHSFVHYDIPCNVSIGEYGLSVLHKNSSLNFDGEGAEFKIGKNGSMLYKDGDGVFLTFEQNSYCLDGVALPSSSEGLIEFSGDVSSDMFLYVCLPPVAPDEPEKSPEAKEREFILYKVIIPLATAFIVLTLAIYFLTWSEQAIHGYTVSFYLITLLVLYIFLIVTNIPSIAREYPSACTFIAVGIHFSYLSSICWLTSISFDVWRNFKFLKMEIEPAAVKRRGMRRFILFCIFSFGYPLLQVGLGLILDEAYRNVDDAQIPVRIPKYGRGNGACTISNDGMTYYLYTPIGILLGCNFGLFIATVFSITDLRKSIRQSFSKISPNNRSAVNQSSSCMTVSRFVTYVRLALIMGIFWISQFIAWFAREENGQPVMQSIDIIETVTDALTVLQAVVIFYIFVCKKPVFVKLWQLHPWLRPLLRLFIRFGCCMEPPDLRKTSAYSATFSKKGTLRHKISSWEYRSSNGSAISDFTKQNRKTLSDEDRKTSVNSNSTEMSEVDSNLRGSWNSEKVIVNSETLC